MLMTKWESDHRNDFISFIKIASEDPLMGSLRGHLWESLVHAYLPRGGTFRVRVLQQDGKGPEFVFNFKQSQSINLKNIDDANLYPPTGKSWLRPIIPTFESVDAILPGCGTFQITVSKRHGIKQQGLSIVLGKLQHHPDNYNLYFVLPPEIYQTFVKPQPYKTLDNKNSQAIPTNVQKVVQYALEFEAPKIEQK